MVIVSFLVGVAVVGCVTGLGLRRAHARPSSPPVARVTAAGASTAFSGSAVAIAVLAGGPGPVPELLPTWIVTAVVTLTAATTLAAAARVVRCTIELGRSYESLERHTDAVIETSMLPVTPLVPDEEPTLHR